jgi:hypothetical protein
MLVKGLPGLSLTVCFWRSGLPGPDHLGILVRPAALVLAFTMVVAGYGGY